MPPPVASQSPLPRSRPTTEELVAALDARLVEQFCLTISSPYLIVVEGQTDVDYLIHASKQIHNRTGEDWLCATASGLGIAESIQVLAPGSPGFPNRGGVKRITALASELHPFVFTLATYTSLAFVFDFDKAGEDGQADLRNKGYRPDFHTFILHPKDHPDACYNKLGTCIEDLLSLRIQLKFFEQGGCSCRAHFVEGQPVRFAWDHPSKDHLRDFVLEHGDLEDVLEIARLLYRVRMAWGLPTNKAILSRG